MSTRSYIGIREKGNFIKYVYCHFDGYTISGVGQMLFEHYKDEEKVKELISLGDISFLEKNINPSKDSNHSFYTPEKDVTVFYHRDRGDEESEAWKTHDFHQFSFLKILVNIAFAKSKLSISARLYTMKLIPENSTS